MARRVKNLWLAGILLALALSLNACQPAFETSSQQLPPPAPTLQIAPLAETGEAAWKLAAADTLTVTVEAPQATAVHLLYQPEAGLTELPSETPSTAQTAASSHYRLATQNAAQSPAAGTFSLSLALTPDFAGEVWAEAVYANGTQRATERLALASGALPGQSAAAPAEMGGSVGTDESARSDKLTGGKLSRGTLKPGEPDIRLTVNLPAFLLTLWQNNQVIKTYQVAIGRPSFPVPVGEREATAIIFNPHWIPPNSAWVRRNQQVEPYEQITATDPRNPLGKLKIPLGAGYLIHEAASEDELGRAVSHGCIRMRRTDLLELAELIIAARSLPVTPPQIEQLGKGTERLAVPLSTPLLVDINYDLQVVEGGLLHLYPDVYGRGAFALTALRAELQSAGVPTAKLGDEQLQILLDQITPDEQFVISIANLKRGRWAAGGSLPLTTQLVTARQREPLSRRLKASM